MASTSARRIRVANPDLTQSEKLILDADLASGGGTSTVKSNYGISANDILVFEQPGTEKAECVVVTSTTGNTSIAHGTVKFAHQKGTIIYRSEYDQVEFSYRTSSAGSWAVLDTIGIKWDDVETIKIHQGATSAYEYRFRFKNSVSLNYSEYSPTVAGSGYTASQIGSQVVEVRAVIIDPDRKIVSDEQIIDFLTEAKNIIKGIRNNWWFWLKEDEGTITTEADTREYDLDDISSRIEYIKDVRFRNVANDDDVTYHLKWLPPLVFDQHIMDNDEDSDDDVARYTILPPDSSSTAGYLKVDPAPETTDNGSFYIRYYEPDADFDDVADTTAIPLPFILSDYAISKCEHIKGNDERAAIFFKKFMGPASGNRSRSNLTGIALLEQMQRSKFRPIGQPQSIKYFRGREPIRRFFGVAGMDRDYRAEAYFDYPIK